MLKFPLLLHGFGVFASHFPKATLYVFPDLRRGDAQRRCNLVTCGSPHLHLNDATAALLGCYASAVLFRHFAPDWLPLL